MQLFNKTFILEGLHNLTVDFIEKFIESMGFAPLRWCVVEIRDDNFIVEAVLSEKFKNCNK